MWSTLGATGAIYALRRRLLASAAGRDAAGRRAGADAAVLAGWRIVFEERAHAFDRAAPDAAAESRRKMRTLAGNYQILAQEPRLLVPFVNPVWLHYMSHKVGRLARAVGARRVLGLERCACARQLVLRGGARRPGDLLRAGASGRWSNGVGDRHARVE